MPDSLKSFLTASIAAGSLIIVASPSLAQTEAAQAETSGAAAQQGEAAEAVAAKALNIDAPHTFQPIPGLPVAGYLELTSEGFDDRLIGASSAVADSVRFRQTELDSDGIAMMQPVTEIYVTDGTPVLFEKNGLHLLLEGLQGEYRPGDGIPVTLTFADQGDITIQLKVFQRGERVLSSDEMARVEQGARMQAQADADGVADDTPGTASTSGTSSDPAGNLFDRLRNRASGLTDDVTGSVSDQTEALSENAAELAEQARIRAEAAREQAEATAQSLRERTDEALEASREGLASARSSINQAIDNRGEIAAAVRDGAGDVVQQTGEALAESSKGFMGRLRDAFRADQ